MPKAPSATNSSRPALRRNQACKTCRKRKLKCDAARPHCGTCVKQWQTAISVPAPVGYSHPSEPQCSYDPVEGLSLAPDTDPLEKIKELEADIVKLKEQLFEAHNAQKATTSPASHLQSRLSASPRLQRSSSSASPVSGEPAPPNSIKLPSTPMALMHLLSPESPETISRRKQEFDHIQNISMRHKDTSLYLELLVSGWNPDLPDPKTLMHYVETFFRCDPCASHVLHRPSLMASLSLPAKDPNFPHASILHAICACASRWTPRRDQDGKKKASFAEFHAGKTRQYIDRTMASGNDIFPVMQACTLLSWFFYHEGRWVEVWVFAGFQARVAIPLRLNYPGTVAPSNPSEGQYLPQPKSAVDLEGRRRTWWMTVMFDRMCSVAGWVHAIDEQDIGTEFPSTNYAFEHEQCQGTNPQGITTPDLFTSHPLEYTDSYILLLKSMLLFGRVTDFCVRHGIKTKGAPTRHQDPYKLPGFAELDDLVSSTFLESLPTAFKASAGVTDSPEGSRLDTDLYMVRVLPHAATITLHNPYIDFGDSNCVSTARCVKAARAILNLYYHLSSISVDVSRLHPLIAICWYLAAAVQVQLCKYFIEVGNTESESAVWGEINIMRFAMLEFGATSPIGTRQEGILQGLMQEIVRTTVHKQPLELGMPLYPFSRNTLWRKGYGGSGGMSDEMGDGDVDDVLDAALGQRRVPSPVMTLTSSHSPTSTITGGSPGVVPGVPSEYTRLRTSPAVMNGATGTSYAAQETYPQPVEQYQHQYDHAGPSSSSSHQYQQRQQVPLMQQQQNFPAHHQGYTTAGAYPSLPPTPGPYVYPDPPSTAGTLIGSGSPNESYGATGSNVTVSGMVGAEEVPVYADNAGGDMYTQGSYSMNAGAGAEEYGNRWG